MKNSIYLLVLALLISLGQSQTTVFPELIKNGSFTSGGSDWTLWNWTDPQGRSANVKASYKNGLAMLDFTQHIDYPTFEYWAVTWSTGPVTLERRQWYRLQFEAWGSDSTGFNVAILGPWDAVKLTQNFYLSRRSPTVTKQKQVFVYEFRHSYTGLNNDGRLSIQMARSPADTLFFDNFSLKGIPEDSLTTSISNRAGHKDFLEPELTYFSAKKEAFLFYNPQNKPQKVSAYTLEGRLLRAWNIQPKNSLQTQALNVRGLPLGMAIFKMENGSETYSQKLFITP